MARIPELLLEEGEGRLRSCQGDRADRLSAVVHVYGQLAACMVTLGLSKS